MKSFYSIFTKTKNVDLMKFGTICYSLIEHGWDSHIVTFNIDDYIYLETDVKGLKLDFLEEKYSIEVLNSIRFLRLNAKNIDVLMLLHYTIPTLLLFFFYKLFNKNGKLVLLTDMDYNSARRVTGFKKGFRYSIETFVTTKILFKYYIDLAIVATPEVEELYLNSYDIFKDKVKYLPFLMKPLDIEKVPKKNCIISVGRIGSDQKASDIVLNAFKNIKYKKDWTLKMVGPISEEFKPFIDNYFKENPELKDSVIFTGNITNKEELYSVYADSKVFCLPSRYGSFEIVFLEALCYNNYLVLTDVGIANTLIKQSNYGQLVDIDDVEGLTRVLEDIINNHNNYIKDDVDFRDLIEKHYSIKSAGVRFNKYLNDILD